MEQEPMTLQQKIDEAANNWNKLTYGHYSFKRWSVPTTTSIKTDSRWNSVDK